MKNPLLLLLLAIPFSGFCLEADDFNREAKPQSAAWLERGCGLVFVFKSEPKSTTNHQAMAALETMTWCEGIISGMIIADISGNSSSHLSKPPEEWRDPVNVASSVLQFMRKHEKDISPETAAWKVMLCWYLISHPKATEQDKNNGLNLLASFNGTKGREVRRAIPVR